MYSHKYCQLKEELLLQLPQPLRLTLPVGTFRKKAEKKAADRQPELAILEITDKELLFIVSS